MAEAERIAVAAQGPSAQELKAAPLIDPWVPGSRRMYGYCLAGRVDGRADWDSKRVLTSPLRVLEPYQGWAYDRDGWYRLGQRLSMSEFDEKHVRNCSKQIDECGDDELALALLANRARTVWQLSQLKAPQA